MDQKSLVRIVEMDNLIRNGKYPNCKFLQKHLCVSERTVLRDIDLFKKLFNAPIRYSKSKNGYYYSDLSFVLNDIKLTEGDLLSLLVGQNVLNFYKNTPFYDDLQRSFQKITVLLPDYIQISENNFFDISVDMYDSMMLNKKNIKVFKAILQSLDEKKRLKIEYKDILEDEKVYSVAISPGKVKFYNGEWYLSALNHITGKKVQFNIKRIGTIRKLKETAMDFDVNDDDDQLSMTQEKMIVIAEFSKTISAVIADKFAENAHKVKRLSNGKLEVEFVQTDIHSLYQWLLSFGSHVEIIQPVMLRNRIRKDLIKMLSMY
ncbi:MAG: hypothetical protein A2Y40_07385 [Candidatus Margulisbacteria bacterium GWF2_35_9]|nr:MAG: hypothetical protein A2Y40_07385 [Candidatus Margulisbacteria bacterium GWF2_35_9]